MRADFAHKDARLDQAARLAEQLQKGARVGQGRGRRQAGCGCRGGQRRTVALEGEGSAQVEQGVAQGHGTVGELLLQGGQRFLDDEQAALGALQPRRQVFGDFAVQHLPVTEGRAELAQNQGHQHAAEKELGRKFHGRSAMEQRGGELPERRVKPHAEQPVSGAVTHRDQPGAEPGPGKTGVGAQRIIRPELGAQPQHQHRQQHGFEHRHQPPRLRIRSPVAQPLPAHTRRLAAHAAADAGGEIVEFHAAVRKTLGAERVRAWRRVFRPRPSRGCRAEALRSATARPRLAPDSPSLSGRRWRSRPLGLSARR